MRWSTYYSNYQQINYFFFNPLTGKRVRLRPVWKNLWKLQILVLSRQESQRYLPMPNCKFLQIYGHYFFTSHYYQWFCWQQNSKLSNSNSKSQWQHIFPNLRLQSCVIKLFIFCIYFLVSLSCSLLILFLLEKRCVFLYPSIF